MKFCTVCGTLVDAAPPAADAPPAPPAPAVEPAAAASVAAPPAPPAGPSIFELIRVERFIAAAIHGAIAFGIAWVLALIATILTVLGLGSLHPDLSIIITAPAQLVGLALGGVFSIGTSAAGVSASVSVLFLPVLLTLVVIATAWFTGRRNERIEAAPSRGARWLLAGTTGVVLAIIAMLLALITTVRLPGIDVGLGISLSDATGSALSVTLFFGALVAGTLASYVGRASVKPAAAVSTARALVVAPIRAFLAVTAVLGILIALTVLIVSAVQGGLGAFAVALGWLPSAVIEGLALVLFVPLGVTGAGSLLGSGPSSNLWLPSMVPGWVTVIVIVVLLAVIVIGGVALRVGRTAAAAKTSTQWGTTVGIFAVGGILISIFGTLVGWTSVNTGGSGTLGSLVKNATQVNASFGPPPWTFIVFAALGALVQLASLFVAPLLIPLLPARLRAAASVESTAPMDPARKRLVVVVSIIVGAAALVAILAVVGGSIVNQVVFGPETQVRAFLDDVVKKDADAAVKAGFVDPAIGTGNELLSNAALLAAGPGVTSYSIVRSSTHGDTGLVWVNVQIDGSTSMTSYSLTKNGSNFLLFDKWKLDPVQLSKVSVSFPASATSISINGITVKPTSSERNDGQLERPAFPGTYKVDLGGDKKWIAADPKSAVVDFEGDSESSVSLSVTATQALRDEINTQLASFLTNCAASTELSPSGCPFSTYSYSTASNVVWTVLTAPAIDLEIEDSGVLVSTDSSGSASVSYNTTDYFGTGVTPQTDTVSFSVYGSVSFDSSGNPTFTVNSND